MLHVNRIHLNCLHFASRRRAAVYHAYRDPCLALSACLLFLEHVAEDDIFLQGSTAMDELVNE